MLRLGHVAPTTDLLGARASRPRSQVLVLAVAVCLLGGCHKGPVGADRTPDEKHIVKIVSLYNDYRGAHHGQEPRDAKELKEWAKGLKKDKLAARGIDNLDEAFTSPRDKQPYVLVTGKAAKPGAFGRPALLWVYEKTGVDGKRMGANPMGYAFEMDEETFKKMLPAGH